MSRLLSIIVPVYNAQNYLSRCLDSILCQTYKNIEIILIDDGSKDSSPSICDEYAQKDKRIRVFHQNNHGQGYSRKKGIELSNGAYITFVDNDDYIRPKMYETMITLLENKNVDICACLWNYETEDGYQSVDPSKYKYLVGKYHSFDFAHLFFTNDSYEAGIVGSPWNKVYKKNVLNNIISTGKIGEDEEMMDSILTKGCNIYVDNNDFYIWCYHNTSMSHKGFTKEHLHRLDINYNRIKLYNYDTWMVYQSQLRYCNLCIEFYYEMVKLGCKFPHKYIHQLKQINYNLFMNKKYKPGFKFHLRMLIFLTSPLLYKRIILRK